MHGFISIIYLGDMRFHVSMLCFMIHFSFQVNAFVANHMKSVFASDFVPSGLLCFVSVVSVGGRIRFLFVGGWSCAFKCCDLCTVVVPA